MTSDNFNYRDTSNWFINKLQRQAVRQIIFDLADDQFQEECRWLMRLWWYVGQADTAPNRITLFANLSPAKQAIIEELFNAIAKNPEAVKDWIEKYRQPTELEDE